MKTNKATRKTRACTIDKLDEELKSAIRAHEVKYGLEDLESGILMGCEVITVQQKKAFLGGIQATLSAVHVPPKWLVWANSNGPNNVVVGTVPLNQMDVSDYRSSAPYTLTHSRARTQHY